MPTNAPHWSSAVVFLTLIMDQNMVISDLINLIDSGTLQSRISACENLTLVDLNDVQKEIIVTKLQSYFDNNYGSVLFAQVAALELFIFLRHHNKAFVAILKNLLTTFVPFDSESNDVKVLVSYAVKSLQAIGVDITQIAAEVIQRLRAYIHNTSVSPQSSPASELTEDLRLLRNIAPYCSAAYCISVTRLLLDFCTCMSNKYPSDSHQTMTRDSQLREYLVSCNNDAKVLILSFFLCQLTDSAVLKSSSYVLRCVNALKWKVSTISDWKRDGVAVPLYIYINQLPAVLVSDELNAHDTGVFATLTSKFNIPSDVVTDIKRYFPVRAVPPSLFTPVGYGVNPVTDIAERYAASVTEELLSEFVSFVASEGVSLLLCSVAHLQERLVPLIDPHIARIIIQKLLISVTDSTENKDHINLCARALFKLFRFTSTDQYIYCVTLFLNVGQGTLSNVRMHNKDKSIVNFDPKFDEVIVDIIVRKLDISLTYELFTALTRAINVASQYPRLLAIKIYLHIAPRIIAYASASASTTNKQLGATNNNNSSELNENNHNYNAHNAMEMNIPMEYLTYLCNVIIPMVANRIDGSDTKAEYTSRVDFAGCLMAQHLIALNCDGFLETLMATMDDPAQVEMTKVLIGLLQITTDAQFAAILNSLLHVNAAHGFTHPVPSAAQISALKVDKQDIFHSLLFSKLVSQPLGKLIRVVLPHLRNLFHWAAAFPDGENNVKTCEVFFVTLRMWTYCIKTQYEVQGSSVLDSVEKITRQVKEIAKVFAAALLEKCPSDLLHLVSSFVMKVENEDRNADLRRFLLTTLALLHIVYVSSGCAIVSVVLQLLSVPDTRVCNDLEVLLAANDAFIVRLATAEQHVCLFDLLLERCVTQHTYRLFSDSTNTMDSLTLHNGEVLIRVEEGMGDMRLTCKRHTDDVVFKMRDPDRRFFMQMTTAPRTNTLSCFQKTQIKQIQQSAEKLYPLLTPNNEAIALGALLDLVIHMPSQLLSSARLVLLNKFPFTPDNEAAVFELAEALDARFPPETSRSSVLSSVFALWSDLAVCDDSAARLAALQKLKGLGEKFSNNSDYNTTIADLHHTARQQSTLLYKEFLLYFYSHPSVSVEPSDALTITTSLSTSVRRPEHVRDISALAELFHTVNQLDNAVDVLIKAFKAVSAKLDMKVEVLRGLTSVVRLSSAEKQQALLEQFSGVTKEKNTDVILSGVRLLVTLCALNIQFFSHVLDIVTQFLGSGKHDAHSAAYQSVVMSLAVLWDASPSSAIAIDEINRHFDVTDIASSNSGDSAVRRSLLVHSLLFSRHSHLHIHALNESALGSLPELFVSSHCAADQLISQCEQFPTRRLPLSLELVCALATAASKLPLKETALTAISKILSDKSMDSYTVSEKLLKVLTPTFTHDVSKKEFQLKAIDLLACSIPVPLMIDTVERLILVTPYDTKTDSSPVLLDVVTSRIAAICSRGDHDIIQLLTERVVGVIHGDHHNSILFTALSAFSTLLQTQPQLLTESILECLLSHITAHEKFKFTNTQQATSSDSKTVYVGFNNSSDKAVVTIELGISDVVSLLPSAAVSGRGDDSRNSSCSNSNSGSVELSNAAYTKSEYRSSAKNTMYKAVPADLYQRLVDKLTTLKNNGGSGMCFTLNIEDKVALSSLLKGMERAGHTYYDHSMQSIAKQCLALLSRHLSLLSPDNYMRVLPLFLHAQSFNNNQAEFIKASVVVGSLPFTKLWEFVDFLMIEIYKPSNRSRRYCRSLLNQLRAYPVLMAEVEAKRDGGSVLVSKYAERVLNYINDAL